jgi:DNA-binding Lrp family transcriptional regulator
MDPESRHELELLEALAEDAHSTQRSLSAKVGIALGLTNIYLKRLVRKGYVKCVNVKSNRLMYLVTPTGLSEKTRLTYEFMAYSLSLYKNARDRVRAVLEPLARAGGCRIAIYGTGEAAELTYMCLKEIGVEPVVNFVENGVAGTFGLRTRPIGEYQTIPLDALIVATFEEPTPLLAFLEQSGVPRSHLLPIREPARTESK